MDVFLGGLDRSGCRLRRLQGGEAFASQGGEFVEELLEGFGLRLLHLREAIEGREWLRVAVCEDVADAGHPVVALGLGQVPYDVVGAPCVGAFVAAGPGIGEASEEGVESRRGAGEESDGLGHGMDEYRLRYADGMFLARQQQKRNTGVSPLRDRR